MALLLTDRRAGLRDGLLGFACGLMCASTVSAQPGASLDDLEILASLNAKVTLTDTNGREFRGRVDDASESMLSLRTGDTIRRFAADEVRSVRARRDDSVVNGTLVGLAVAGGLSSLIFLDNECRGDSTCYAAVAVYAGVGALAGMGIDGLMHREVVVYPAPAPGAQRVVTVSPLMAQGRRGARLTVAW